MLPIIRNESSALQLRSSQFSNMGRISSCGRISSVLSWTGLDYSRQGSAARSKLCGVIHSPLPISNLSSSAAAFHRSTLLLKPRSLSAMRTHILTKMQSAILRHIHVFETKQIPELSADAVWRLSHQMLVFTEQERMEKQNSNTNN